MTTPAAEPLRRGEITLIAFGAASVVALATSTLLLWGRGISPGFAIVAALPPSILLGFIGLGSRYLCRAMPLRTASRMSIIATHSGSAAAASGLWVLTWKSWLDVLDRRASTQVAPDFTVLFGLGVLLVLSTVAVQYLVLEVETSREAEEAALRYRVLAREAELRAFKAQLDPHFLFNSLNAVASLCGSRPADAREMAQRLADFFRLVLRLGARERIPLADEIDLVSRYLAIEKVRFGERLAVHIEMDEAAATFMIPPLLLQPLIENAVRHGVAEMVEGGAIDVAATMHDDALHIRIENPADPERADARGEGIGLRNARGRLNAVSDGRALLTAVEAAGRFRVDIELPR